MPIKLFKCGFPDCQETNEFPTIGLKCWEYLPRFSSWFCYEHAQQIEQEIERGGFDESAKRKKRKD